MKTVFLYVWKSCSFNENETTTFFFHFYRGEELSENKVSSRVVVLKIHFESGGNLLNSLCCSLPSRFILV